MVHYDEFTDFSFNDISSRKMKVIITNSNDLTDNITPTFSDTFTSPTFGDGRYYAGTSVSNRDFKLECAAIDITEKDRKNIAAWLSPRSTGKLTFGFDPFHYYNVKINSEITATKWVKGHYDQRLGRYLYIYTFTVKFTTVDDWAKLSFPYTADLDEFKEAEEREDLSDSTDFLNHYNQYNLPVLMYNSLQIIPKGKYTADELIAITNLDQWSLYPLALDLTSSNLVPKDALNIKKHNITDDSTNYITFTVNQEINEEYFDTIDADVTDTNNSNVFDSVVLYYDCIYCKENADYKKYFTVTNIGTESLKLTYSAYGSIYTGCELSIEYDYCTKLFTNLASNSALNDSSIPLNIQYDNSNGIIYNSGTLLQNTTDSFGFNIWDSNDYVNTNGFIVPSGEAETILLDAPVKQEYWEFTIGSESEKQYFNYLIIPNDFINNHQGLVHLSFSNKMIQKSSGYSEIIASFVTDTRPDTEDYIGYCVQSNNSNYLVVYILGNQYSESEMSSAYKEYIGDYECLNISNAHVLSFDVSNSEYYILSGYGGTNNVVNALPTNYYKNTEITTTDESKKNEILAEYLTIQSREA